MGKKVVAIRPLRGLRGRSENPEIHYAFKTFIYFRITYILSPGGSARRGEATTVHLFRKTKATTVRLIYCRRRIIEKVKIVTYIQRKMSGERNRRTLAFRGGGLAGLTGSSAVGGGNCNSCEALSCQDRQFNGNRPDQEEDRDLGANGTSQKRVEGAGSVSDSTEPEAEEEEDPEGGSGPVEEGECRIASVETEDGCWEGNGFTAGSKPNSVDVRESGSGATETETGPRKSGVEMRPQMLLLKHSQFHASWLQEFPWLKFCQETGLMSCSWCHNFATKNSDELVKGSRNYKRALLLRHHLSSEHGRNDPTKQVTLTQVRRNFAFFFF